MPLRGDQVDDLLERVAVLEEWKRLLERDRRDYRRVVHTVIAGLILWVLTVIGGHFWTIASVNQTVHQDVPAAVSRCLNHMSKCGGKRTP